MADLGSLNGRPVRKPTQFRADGKSGIGSLQFSFRVAHHSTQTASDEGDHPAAIPTMRLAKTWLFPVDFETTRSSARLSLRMSWPGI